MSDGVDLWAIDDRNYDWANKTGCLWVFTDCLTGSPQPSPSPSPEIFFKAPIPTSPAMDEVIPTDTSSGEIADVTFKWKHPTEAKKYALWVAKDKEFSQIVMQKNIVPSSPPAPKWILYPGTSPLKPGETYFWKVRVIHAATGVTGNGEWSEVMSFTVAPGLPDETPHPGPTLLTPADDATNVERSPSFSWTPLPGAKEYELILATDEALTQVFARTKVPQASYHYDAELQAGATYFWQVKANRPFLSKPSPVFSFMVAVEKETEPSTVASNLPSWLWIVTIAFGAALIAALITALVIIRKRRSRAP